MAGGPIFPSPPTYDTSGNVFPRIYVPTTNTNAAGYIEGTGVAASLGADCTATLQFNLPEVIPPGTLKCRVLAWSGATSGVAKLTLSDGQTTAGSNIGATTLTGDTQISQTWTTADVIVENKVTLSTNPIANRILTILATFNHTGWTLASISVWQFSLIWE